MVRALALALCAACVPTSRRAIEGAPPEELRRVMADPEAHPNEQDAARARLAGLEWERVKAAPSVLAVKRWLQEFRGTSLSPDAERLLEELRYREAEGQGEDALREFLREHPKADRAGAARERIGAAELERALKTPSSESLQRWLRAYPDFPDADARAHAQAALEDRLFAEAREGGEAGLDRYLERPDAPHAAEARALRERLLREAQARWALEDAEAALDPLLLDAVARDHAGTESAARAAARARDLRAHKRGRALRDLAEQAAPGSGARTVAALRVDVASADPVARRLAAMELRLRPSPEALDAALEAFDSPDASVRDEAALTVEAILGAFSDERRGHEFRAREAKLRRRALAGTPLARLAALRAGARDPAAADTWRAVLASDGMDLAAAAALARLEQGFPARPIAWRRLGKIAAEVASARTEEAGAAGRRAEAARPEHSAGEARCTALHFLGLAAASLDATGLQGRDRADVEDWRALLEKDLARLRAPCPPRLTLHQLLREAVLGQARALEQLAREGEVARPALARASRAGLAMTCAQALIAGAAVCPPP